MTRTATPAATPTPTPTAIPTPTPTANRVGTRLTAEDLGVALGSAATVVQFSSAFCQPCRMTRLVVDRAVGTSESEPGASHAVRHVDLDVADHTALAERLAILSTPTVLVLDAVGDERVRATGVPRLAQVRAAIAVASAR